MLKRLVLLIMASAVSNVLLAQGVYVPVNAPYAQDLVVATKNAHPELQKLGLHAIPPGQHDYAIIASPITSKVGKKSSASDLTVVTSGRPTVKPTERGEFFDLCLPISDASGNSIGITVMEIPYAFAKDSDEALAKAVRVRDEMQNKIASHDQLFADTDQPLQKMQSIALGAGVKGRFDHISVDLKHNRLFAAAEDTHAVLILDSVDSSMTTQISGIGKPHAILYREDLDRIYITDGDDGTLKIFNGKTYQPVSSVALAKDADSIGYEPSRHLLYIDNGGKDAGQRYSMVSVVDATAGKKLTDIRVESDTLEAMALDIWRPRMYVNNRAGNQVTVINNWTNSITASWPITMGHDNVAMGLDEAHQRLFVGCRDGHVVIFDSNTGKQLQALSISKGIDDLEYDIASRRLYAIGSGKIDVYQEIDADHYHSLGTITVGAEAKTARLVAAVNRYFVAVPQTAYNQASVESFQPINIPVATPVAAEVSQPVAAPHALKIEMEMLSAHPDFRKMGLHAVPPGGKDSVIIANANTSRIGIKSSQGDLDAVKDGKIYCIKRDDGSFFNVKMPLQDISGRVIGILVMEMPITSADDEKEAVHKALGIQHEVAQMIPDYQSLFQ
jgi:DNA-binding beta-propeller fold protein YncE